MSDYPYREPYEEGFSDGKDEAKERIAELKAELDEHEYRWKWLNRSVLALSNEGYGKWASVVLALINKCRYEALQERGG